MIYSECECKWAGRCHIPPERWGGWGRGTCQMPCPHSANSQMPNKEIISLSHWYNLSFHPVSQWNHLWLFITSPVPSILFFLLLSLASSNPSSLICRSPFALSAFYPIHSLLYSSFPLTLQTVFALKSLLLLFLHLSLALPVSLSLRLWRKITHSSVCRLCSWRAGSQGEY